MKAIERLLAHARDERNEVWKKLSYRDSAIKPTMIEVTAWVERLKELGAIIEFLQEHLKRTSK
jgi:hypothetical protein